MRSLILALLFVPLAAPASTAEPTEAELNDWMAFLRSVSLPVTTEICAPLVAGKADYAAAASQWTTVHQSEIDRGREFARAGSPAGRDFEQYHAAMAADFKAKLSAKPESARAAICEDSLKVLKKAAPAAGA
jgi:hypothetical protein